MDEEFKKEKMTKKLVVPYGESLARCYKSLETVNPELFSALNKEIVDELDLSNPILESLQLIKTQKSIVWKKVTSKQFAKNMGHDELYNCCIGDITEGVISHYLIFSPDKTKEMAQLIKEWLASEMLDAPNYLMIKMQLDSYLLDVPEED